MFLAFSNFLFTSAFVPHSYRGIVKHLDSRTGNNNTKSILDNFRKWIVNGNKPRPATLINLSKNSRYGISCAKLVRDLYETDKVDNDRLNRILRECADNSVMLDFELCPECYKWICDRDQEINNYLRSTSGQKNSLLSKSALPETLKQRLVYIDAVDAKLSKPALFEFYLEFFMFYLAVFAACLHGNLVQEIVSCDGNYLNEFIERLKNKVHETGHTLQELADKAFGNVNQKMSEQSLRRYLTPESIINPSLLQTIVYAFYDVVLDEKIKLKMTRDDLFHVWATLVSKLHVLDCLDIDNPGFADKRYKIAGESPISKSFFRKSVSRLPEWIQFARERIFQLSEG